MKSKLTDNDPRLTAYALGELSRDEAEEITDALALGENIFLKKEVENIDSLGVMLTQVLNEPVMSTDGVKEPQIKLRASQRDAIFRSAKAPTVDDVSSAHQSRWLRPVVVTLSAAALVTLSFMILNNVDSDDPSATKFSEVSFSELSKDELSAPILQSNKEWGVSASNANPSLSDNSAYLSSGFPTNFRAVTFNDDPTSLIKLEENGWINRAESAVTRMPLVCGKASWGWLSKSILESEILPSADVVREEEILNAFDYDMSSDLELKHTSVSVDVVRCPWNMNNLIAVIYIENTFQDNIQIETAVNFSEKVNQYRVVGYAKSQNPSENIIAPAQVTMASGGSHIVMYEIVPEEEIENAADILSLDVRTVAVIDGDIENDSKTLDLQFSDRDWTKANQGIQFALILATWSQLISESDYVGSLNGEIIESMITSFTEKYQVNDQKQKAFDVLRKGILLL